MAVRSPIYIDDGRIDGVDLLPIEIRGDSMEPTLRAGDVVIVDPRDLAPSPEGLFAVWDGLAAIVRRVQVLNGAGPPRLRLTPDNGRYTAFETPMEDAVVLGRVVWLTRRA